MLNICAKPLFALKNNFCNAIARFALLYIEGTSEDQYLALTLNCWSKQRCVEIERQRLPVKVVVACRIIRQVDRTAAADAYRIDFKVAISRTQKADLASIG